MPLRHSRTSVWLPFFCLLLLLASSRPAAASVPQVVVTIQPIHSLVSGLMAGLGEPHLLLRGGASPHGYALRPSDARQLGSADLVVWVGPELEGFLSRSLPSLAARAQPLALLDAPDVTVLAQRRGGDWEHDHRHPASGAPDAHIWLSPDNARAIVNSVASALVALDPSNAAIYQGNQRQLLERLDALDQALAQRLTPVRDVPYIVFHDAYQYFEQYYSLAARGAIAVSPEQPPGVRRLREIRAKLRETEARCVFSEPQFEPALVATVSAGTAARHGVLDPLGAELPPGPEAYFTLMDNLADALVSCLGAP